jgi:hypothetical protein
MLYAYKGAGILYACKGSHTLFNGQRERLKEREREREREGVRKRVRERDVEYGSFNRNDRCLGTF